MTYRELRRALGDELSGEYKNEADMIISHLGGISRSELVISDDEVGIDAYGRIKTAVQRRNGGDPLQYIIGVCGFYNLELYCKEGVLIPRFDTEILVSEAIKGLPENAVFADICCGSGCIACAILYNRPDTRAVCVDISDNAVSLTNENLSKYSLGSRANVIRRDITESWDGLPCFDAVVSNPPYIASRELDGLPADVRREPVTALDGGEDGLDFYRAIIKRASEHNGGCKHILFETGYDQGKALAGLALSFGMACQTIKDYSGLDRVSILTKH